MVGSAFNNIDTSHEIVSVGSRDFDLTDYSSVDAMLEKIKPDAIIHLAARVGGVKGNTDYVADFYSENIRMNTNVLDLACKKGVSKVVSLLSTCIYPDEATYPLTEDQIHEGRPHPSNFGYAYAKRMLDIQSRALRKQYNCDFVCAVPNNIYGINDHFDLENGHVIPAMIRKIWEAKETGSAPVLWGDGSPLREFTYSRDIADVLLFLLENYSDPEPCNIGHTSEVSIKSVSKIICNNLDFDYNKIVWDTSKPSGQFRKPSSSKKLVDLGWAQEDYTSLEEGLKKVCEWFKEKYPRVRGVV